MKRLLLSAVTLLCLGCNSGPCASPYDGTWNGVSTTDQITLTAACEYEYRGDDGCMTDGTYAKPLGASGNVLVTIQTSTPGDCLPVGQYSCGYSVAGNSVLSVDCGGGALSYRR